MRKILALVIIFSILLTTGCKKHDNDINGTITTDAVNSNIVKGQWQVSYFVKNNQTLTGDFTGYKFTFASGGTLTALPSLYTIQGNWALTGSSGVQLNISSFTVPASFQALNGNWQVVVNTATQIRLSNANTSGSTDQVLLEPI